MVCDFLNGIYQGNIFLHLFSKAFTLTNTRLQLFGTFFLIKEVVFDPMETVYFEKVAQRYGQTLTDALLDPYFYDQLRLDKYHHPEDLKGDWYYALDVSQYHVIELWGVGNKKQKFNLNDLHPERTLFPLYPTKDFQIPQMRAPLSITIKEKGRALFDLNLSFNALETQLHFGVCLKQQLIHTIALQNKKILPHKRDTVVIGGSGIQCFEFY